MPTKPTREHDALDREYRLQRRWTLPRVLRVAAMTIALCAVAILYFRTLLASGDHEGPPLMAGDVTVVQVFDGDTILVEQQQPEGLARRRLRFLAIDTPELAFAKPGEKIDKVDQPFAREATDFVKSRVAQGNVRIELDRRRRDKYGRSLAYVYVENALLQEELLRRGLAKVSSFPGDSMTMLKRMHSAEADARRNGRGIWQAPHAEQK